MENKIKLNVLGLTYTQMQTHAFALILGEEDSKRRLPILIGPIEAQAISLIVNAVSLPRPLTHDLILDALKLNDMVLREVQIYKKEHGIFHAYLVCYREADDTSTKIESRSSDAVALAMLTGCPIYTTEAIMEESAIIIEEHVVESVHYPGFGGEENAPLSELEVKMQKAIEEENYELAAILRDELKSKNEEKE
jgi:bifunctional DNase/RNase